jgi:hypothetical protein
MENIKKISSFKTNKKNIVIKSFNLIGKEENLGIISKIIDKNDKLKIRINSNTILIPKTSYQKIINYSQLILEQNLCFSYQKTKNDDETSKGDSTDVILGHEQKNSNIDKMIFDNEEHQKKVKINFEPIVYENDNETDTLKEKKEILIQNEDLDEDNKRNISRNILKQISNHKYIANHYQDFIISWEILFCIIILLGLNILIHITVLIAKFETLNTFYVFYCGLLSTCFFYIGISSLYKIIMDKENEICMSIINELLIFTDLVSLSAWFIITNLEKGIKLYIITQTYYNSLFIFAIIIETITIILNFAMNEVYKEYELLKETLK